MHSEVLSKDGEQWQIKLVLFCFSKCQIIATLRIWSLRRPAISDFWWVAGQPVACRGAKSLAVLENQVKWERT